MQDIPSSVSIPFRVNENVADFCRRIFVEPLGKIMLAVVVLSLLFTLGWAVFGVREKHMRRISSVLLILTCGLTLLPIFLYGGDAVYTVFADPIYYPFVFAWLVFFTAIFLGRFNIGGKHILFGCSFVLGLLSLMFGLELMKVSVNTWKSTFPAFAHLEIISAIVILQTITYLHRANRTYGMWKIAAAGASFVIVFLQYFEILPPIWADSDIAFENILFLIIAGLTLEGFLLMYKAKSDLAVSNLKGADPKMTEWIS